MTDDDFFTREEVLAGLPAKRASALLFLIESRTAHLVAHSRQAMERFLTEETAEERDLAFLEAFALGRDPPLRPTIQDLERYAPQWAYLVPENPRVRAAMVHLLGQKYTFTYQAVPSIRAALGLDEDAVQVAYRRLYREPLETIYAPRPTPADWLRWAWAALARRLESLPPFWTAFSLTLTETVGAGILALPIALASVGPLAGVVLLMVLGLVSVLTVASMAEAVARSGTIRYGKAFLGRVVADYLGDIGSLILSLGAAIICCVALLTYYIGCSTTLADATPVPAEVWVGLLFLIGLYFLRRKSLNATIASALLVGAVNIGLILILSLLAFTHVRLENLLYVNVPFVGGRPFEPSILQLIFGVVLTAYFGHLSLSNCARVVLRRDPSARSLIWGSMTGTATAMILYCIWVLAVNGAVIPQTLAGQSGTVLVPLAAQVGPIVHVLGSAFAVLGMGMASIHFSLGLFNLVRERLPTPQQPIVVLPRRRGRLLFHPRGKPSEGLRLGLTYLGLERGEAQFRLDVQWAGDTHRLEMAATDRWEATALLDRLPDLHERGVSLTLEVLEASQESVRLRVTSPLALTYEGEWDAAGLKMADVLVLPDPWRQLINWMMHQDEVSLAEVAAHTGQDEGAVRTMLEGLMEQDLVREREGRYQVRFAMRRGRQLPENIWQALGDEGRTTTDERGASFVGRRWSLVCGLSERGRSFLSLSPVAIIFLLVEWLLLSGRESFARPLSFFGVIVVSLLGGVFPVLLLASSRRKGEFVPGIVYRLLGHPLLITGIYCVFLGGIFLHGLVIWQGHVERVGALFVGLLVLGLTMAMVRRGAFAPRVVVELRVGAGLAPALGDRKGRPYTPLAPAQQAIFAVTASGQPGMAEVWLGYPEGEQRYQAATGEVPTPSSLRYAIFQVPAGQAQELKMWAHKVTPEGDSESLPALLDVHCGDETTRFDLKLSGGQALLPLTSGPCQLELTFSEPSTS